MSHNPMNNPACATCRWFGGIEGHGTLHTICKKRPPVCHPLEYEWDQYPRTDRLGWCGEHEPSARTVRAP